MRNIYEKEGIKGLTDALEYGTTDEDFYRLLYDKLEVTRNKFDEYIKLEMKKYTEQ